MLFPNLIYHPSSSWNTAAASCITSLPTALHFTRAKTKQTKNLQLLQMKSTGWPSLCFHWDLLWGLLWDACWRLQEKGVTGSSHCCGCCVCNNYRVKKLWLPNLPVAGLEKMCKLPALQTKLESVLCCCHISFKNGSQGCNASVKDCFHSQEVYTIIFCPVFCCSNLLLSNLACKCSALC